MKKEKDDKREIKEEKNYQFLKIRVFFSNFQITGARERKQVNSD